MKEASEEESKEGDEDKVLKRKNSSKSVTPVSNNVTPDAKEDKEM